MPYIEVKTNKILPDETKTRLSEKLIHTFGNTSSQEVAANIQMAIVDGCWMNFRGNTETGTAHILICPGPLTPKEDYHEIIEAFFPVLEDELRIRKNHIYINILEFQNWGYDGEMVDVSRQSGNSNQ